MKKNKQNILSCGAWCYQPAKEEVVAEIRAALNISFPLATLLAQRGLDKPSAATEFLYPSLNNLPSPFLMKGMQQAVEIIVQGMSERKAIVVYGDYDVDGVTATAILVNFFRDLGVASHFFHPDRFKNGYGLKADLVTALHLESPGILITVDCGISDVGEVDHLVQAGWQVIVTDHHQPPGTLPRAHAILNPWQEGCGFPSKDLAGVGVSFYLAMGLRTYLHQQGYWATRTPPNLKKYLDLVALGTISDMVPLRNINRVLAKVGLEVLTSTENAGLNELMALCHLQRGGKITHEDIAYQLGPRINAAGRMGDAKRASTLLTSEDKRIVRHLAEAIEQENIVRRDMTSQLFAEAATMVAAQGEDAPCIVVHGQNWHLGLLGIISSRLVDMFAKPAIVFGGHGTLKGSARSVPGVNIHEILTACSSVIIEFGGHSSAAGLSLKEDNLALFRDMANEAIRRHQASVPAPPSLTIDYVVTDETVFSELESLGNLLMPFGQGNPEPIFTTDTPCRLRNMQVIGKEKNHLRFSAFIAGRWLDGIGFGFASLINRSTNGEALVSMAFSLKENRFNGQVKPQITLLDALAP